MSRHIHYTKTAAHPRHSTHPSSTSAASPADMTSHLRDSSDLTKKALKAFEGITVRRKLVSFRSIFPHANDTSVKYITGIYDDILALSRPGLYSESVTRAASKLLLDQIGSGQTNHLTQALKRCPLIEVQYFLFTLITTCMNDVEQTHDPLKSKERTAALSASSKEALVLRPVLDFIAQIGAQNDATCRTVLEAGVLNMLLRIYVAFPMISDSAPDDVENKLALFDACRSTLSVLSRSSQNRDTILSHPVCALWTDCCSHPLDYVATTESPFNDRCAAWRQADRSCIKRRLVVIYRGSLWKSNIDSNADMEACVDIVEFTRFKFYDVEIVELAFLAMLKHIVLSGDSARHLINTLVDGTHEESVYIFSGVLRLWLECVSMQMQKNLTPESELSDFLSNRQCRSAVPQIEADQTSYDREKERFLRKIVDVDSALHNLIKFATEAADESPTIRLGMFDAGGLALVLFAFANPDFKLSGLVDNSMKQRNKRVTEPEHGEASLCQPLSLSAINAEVTILSVLIRSSKFRRTWQGHRFQTRLGLCSSLVYILLEGEGRMDDRHAITRALFSKIVSADP